MSAERVLIVDDDEQLLTMMMITLKRGGFEVDGAPDGTKALEMIRANPPYAVLLTDLMLPDISGLELLRQARQVDPRLEAVVITAAGSLNTAISAMRGDGAFDYLLKPLESMSQLLTSIERAAAHRRLVLERQALEAEARAEAERLQAVITSTVDAILAADSGGKEQRGGVITIANPVAERLLGRTDLVGQPATSVLPVELSALVANWQAVGGQRPAVIEIPWKDGSVQMVSLTPLLGNNDSGSKEMAWQGWVMVINDITHLKQLDQLKTQMLMEALNKVRVPLAQAVGALADLSLLASQDERVAEVIYRLNKVWGRIKEWGDDLLSLVSLSSDLVVRPVALNLTEILTEMQREAAVRLNRDWGLNLILDVPPSGLPVVRADSDLLRKLLAGLIRRAAMRSERGAQIRLSAQLQDNQVWIDIRDEGPAVSDADLPHIFDKAFVRLEGESANASFELAMVKTIIDRMGGQVWVGGQGPQGSTVTICLPIATRRSSAR